MLHATKGNSANSNFAISKTSVSAVADVLTAQFISAPLAAGNVSGTVKSYVQALESAATNDARAQILIRILSGDMATVRGTLLAHDNALVVSNEFDSATLTNRAFPVGLTNNTLSTVAALEGDVIAVEIGCRYFVATTGISTTLRLGETGTDLAENETDTADGAPWIEFSQTLIFMDGAQRGPAPRSGITQLGGVAPVGVGTSYALQSLGAKDYKTSDTKVFGKENQQQFFATGNSLPAQPVTYYKLRAYDSGLPGFRTWVSRYLSTIEAPTPIGTYSQLSVSASWLA